MKKFKILALTLAVLMAASAIISCGGDKADTTTTKASTSKVTTTAGTKTTTTTTENNDPREQPETPTTGEAFEAWAAGFTTLTVTDPATTITPFGEAEGVAGLFDGVDGIADASTFTKLAGVVNGGEAEITFKCADSKVVAYAFVTGNDASNYGRTPDEWTLYGSTDGGTTWVEIDYVFQGMMCDASYNQLDFTPFGYTVDADKQATYSDYKIVFTAGVNGFSQFQLNEMYLYTTKAA